MLSYLKPTIRMHVLSTEPAPVHGRLGPPLLISADKSDIIALCTLSPQQNSANDTNYSFP